MRKDLADPKETQTPETASEVERAASPEHGSKLLRRRKLGAPIGLRMLASFLATVSILCLIAVCLGLAAGATIGRMFDAPDWLRAQVEARLEAGAQGLDAQMGQMSVTLTPEFRVEVGIDDLRLVQPGTAREVLALTRLDAQLSRAAVFRGQIQARSVSAAGLFLTVRRSRDGAFDLLFGQGLDTSAPDLGALLAQIDAVAESPALGSLNTAELDALTVEYLDAKSGRSWLIDGGRIAVTRRPDALSARADFALLSGGAGVTTVTASATSPIGSPEVDFGLTLTDMPAADIATQVEALSWLGVLRAPISGALRTGFDRAGALQPINASLQIGTGVLQPSEDTRPIPFEAARAYFTFDPNAQSFEFSDVSVSSDWIETGGRGTAMLDYDEAGLQGLTAQITLQGARANPFEVFETPRALDAAQLDMKIALNPFSVRVGALSLEAGALRAHGSGRAVATPQGWDVSLSAQTPEATPAEILSFWPEQAVPGTRKWVARNVSGGAMRDVQFVLQTEPERPPSVYLGAQIDGARLRYLPNMPPLEELKGRLVLENNKIVIAADNAVARPQDGGAVQAAGTVFSIADVRARPGQGRVDLNTQSSVTAALSLIDNPPLNVMRNANLPSSLAEGQARVKGVLTFPIQAKGDGNLVQYEIGAALSNVVSAQLVANREVRAAALDVAVSRDEVSVSGAGTFDGIPFQGAWRLPLSAERGSRVSRVEAEVTLSEANLAALGVELPQGVVSGTGQGDLTITLPPGAPATFELTSGLAGLGLDIAPLGWSKGRGQTGNFAISGALTQPTRIDSVRLTAPGLSAEGDLALRAAGGVDRVRLSRLAVGDWLDAPVTLTSQGAGQPLAIAIEGGRIDLRGMPGSARSGTGAQSGAVTPVSLALERLQITDVLALRAMRGDMQVGRGLSGTFTGRVNGGAEVSGVARASERGTAYVIRAGDAGAALADAGLFNNLADGDLTLRLSPTGQPGTFDGEAKINGARMTNAPAIAELLNAVSVVGLLTQLNGEGIYFDEIEGRFRLSPGRVILAQSSAVGPSMGISLDGYFDTAQSALDLQGVLSPLYAVNILGRPIARKGEGLFGFNFDMKGPARDPNVSVNPLSAFTPGMFRDIFRRPPPDLKNE